MAKPVENENRVTTFLSNEVLEKIKEQAHINGMSVSAYIRYLIVQEMRRIY